jgi:alpha-N-arabinofuranosidase
VCRHYANACSPRAAERAIEITASLIDLARCDFNYDTWPDDITTKPKSKHKPTICFDEWNIWDPARAPGDKGAEELYDVSDMLAVASWLNVFIRQAKYIGMATIAQSVNVIAPLMTTTRGVVKQTTYWPLLLFSKYMRGRSLAAHVRSTAYTGRTMPEWLASTMDLPLLDVSAALSDDSFVNLAVVNLSSTEAMETALPVIRGPVKVFVVGGNVNHIRDNNVEGNERVYVRESKWGGGEKFIFEKHSFTLLRWKAEGVDLPARTALNGARDGRNGLHHDELDVLSGEFSNGVSLERSTVVSQTRELNGMANGH